MYAGIDTKVMKPPQNLVPLQRKLNLICSIHTWAFNCYSHEFVKRSIHSIHYSRGELRNVLLIHMDVTFPSQEKNSVSISAYIFMSRSPIAMAIELGGNGNRAGRQWQ